MKRHIFWWVFLAMQVLFLVMVIVGAHAGATTPVDCTGVGKVDCKSVHDAAATGTALGVGVLIALWAAVDVIVGGTYGIYRLIKR